MFRFAKQAPSPIASQHTRRCFASRNEPAPSTAAEQRFAKRNKRPAAASLLNTGDVSLRETSPRPAPPPSDVSRSETSEAKQPSRRSLSTQYRRCFASRNEPAPSTAAEQRFAKRNKRAAGAHAELGGGSTGIHSRWRGVCIRPPKGLRRGPDSNRRVTVLQTVA